MYAIPYHNYKKDHINTMLEMNLESLAKLIEGVAKNHA